MPFTAKIFHFFPSFSEVSSQHHDRFLCEEALGEFYFI